MLSFLVLLPEQLRQWRRQRAEWRAWAARRTWMRLEVVYVRDHDVLENALATVRQ